MFARLGRGSQRSAFEGLADSTPVQKSEVTQDELCGVLEVVGRESRLREDVTLDIQGTVFASRFGMSGLRL